LFNVVNNVGLFEIQRESQELGAIQQS